MIDVTTVPFNELLEKIIDNRGKTCPTVEQGQGLPLIATNCIKQEHLHPVFENVRFISDDTYRTWFRGHPLPGDMLFVTKGTPGRVCWVPDPVDFCVAQDMVAIRADVSKVYPKYLFAVLRSKRVQDEIESLHVGSLIPHFKKGDFDKLHIPVPAPKAQVFIGDLHFEICRKIDLLHRQNQTLEHMAETLYRQLFVEEAVTVTTLRKVLQLNYGKALKEEARKPGPFPVVGSSGIVGAHSEPLVKGPGIVIGRKGTLGVVTYLFDAFFPIDTTYYVTSTRGSLYMCYEYFLLKSLDLMHMNSDSAVPGLNRDIALSSEVPAPRIGFPEKFDEICAPLFDKMRENIIQLRVLQQIRDTLLPKLMSGEVSVQHHIRTNKSDTYDLLESPCYETNRSKM